MKKNSGFSVSAIVSAYNSERFMQGRLQNLVEQTLYLKDQLEIIVIDSASPQNEKKIVEEWMARYENIRYLRTEERETVYGAWNRGIKLASGRYIINANTDDRFAPDGLERMAEELDHNSAIDAVYGDWMVTNVENDAFETDTGKFVFHYPDFNPSLLFYYQITSHAVLIRRGVFDSIGGYEAGYKVFGDREFMFRFAASGLKAKKISLIVGLYLEAPESVERSEKSAEQEFAAIREKYLMPENFVRLFGCERLTDKKELAELYAFTGSHGLGFYNWNGKPANDLPFAANVLKIALKLDQENFTALNDLGILYCLNKDYDKGIQLFKEAIQLNISDDDRRLIEFNLVQGENRAAAIGDYKWMKGGMPKIGMPSVETPMVSVIIPTCDRPERLAQALESVKAQTFKNYEIIVVNDGGEDVSGVLDLYRGKCSIVYIRLENRKGPAAARNAGLRAARGKYIAYLDDDDRYYPDHLEIAVRFLEGSEYKVAYTDAYRLWQEKINGEYVVTKKDIPYNFEIDSDLLLIKNLIPTLCIIHERECLEQTGLFDESLHTHEEWDLWIRMSRKYSFGHIRKSTCEFTWRNGDSTTSEKRGDFLRTLQVVYDKNREYSQGKPHVLEGQKEVMNSLRAELLFKYEISQLRIESKPDEVTCPVSVIIPVKNGGEKFRDLLDKLKSQKKVREIEVIVLDSESTDDSPNTARKAGARVIPILQRDFNHGTTRNLGVSEAKGDYLVFTVQDAFPASDYWLYSMVCPFFEYPGLAALSARQFVKPGADLYSQWLNHCITENRNAESDFICSLDGGSRDVDLRYIEGTTKRKLAHLDNVSSCIRKSTLKEFQFRHLIYGEDIDLALRLLKKGKTLGYLTSTGVYHWHDRGSDYVLRHQYTGTREEAHIYGDNGQYFFSRHNISFEALAAHISGFFNLINVSVASLKDMDSEPGDVIRAFTKAFKENIVALSGGAERGRFACPDRKLEQLVRDVVGNAPASVTAGIYNFKQNLLIDEFMNHFESFAEFLFNRIPGTRGMGDDIPSCIYKIFAMTVGIVLSSFYLEEESLNRVTPGLERINQILPKGVSYY
jgi:glycosyltransferase involved in cell wall biosynthesis